MSLLTVDIRDAVRDAVVAAWNVTEVHKGTPRFVKTTVPFAVIYMDSVAMEYVTVTDVQQTYTFEIVGVFAIEGGTVVEDEKLARANELITVLMAEGSFAEYGMMPLASNVNFSEPDDVNESVYEVSVTFTVIYHTTAVVD